MTNCEDRLFIFIYLKKFFFFWLLVYLATNLEKNSRVTGTFFLSFFSS